MNIKQIAVLSCFSLVGWAFCGGIIAIGRKVTTMDVTLIIHAIAVPIIFSVLSWIYHKRFNYTTPVITGLIFLGVVIFMDFFIVAMFFEKSFVMFKSILGTWIPFVLIFISTSVAGLCVNSKKK